MAGAETTMSACAGITTNKTQVYASKDPADAGACQGDLFNDHKVNNDDAFAAEIYRDSSGGRNHQ